MPHIDTASLTTVARALDGIAAAVYFCYGANEAE